MNYSKLSKKLFLSFSILGLLLNAEPSKSAEWEENPQIVSCTTGHLNMSDSAVGADHSKPFSIVSSAYNPHKACLQTPEGYKITLFNIGMCTSNPFNDNNDSVDLAFTESNGCVWTMESSSGTEIDLGANLNQAISLPSASTRPPSGTYKHFVIVMNPNIKLKGSYTTTDPTTLRADTTNNDLPMLLISLLDVPYDSYITSYTITTIIGQTPQITYSSKDRSSRRNFNLYKLIHFCRVGSDVEIFLSRPARKRKTL